MTPYPRWRRVLDDIAVVVILVGVPALLVAGWLGYAQLVYGTWRCAFAECRVVVQPERVSPAP